MNTFILIVTLLIFSALQARLPTLWWLGGLRIEFLPALVAYGALTLRRSGALLLALAAGCLQDALSAGPFGLTALIYGTFVLATITVREVLDRDLPWVQMGAGALAAGAASLAACAVIGFSFSAVAKIVLVALASAVVTPLVFFIIDYLGLLAENA